MSNGKNIYTDAIRVAIYARLSSGKQQDASIDDQVEAARQYCKRKGYEIVEIYADNATSGSSDECPQLLQMINDAKEGKFGIVVAWSADRFSRDMIDKVQYENELRLNGVVLELCDSGTSNDRAEANMKDAILRAILDEYQDE